MENYFNDVARLCDVSVDDINNLSQGQIVREFILPKAVRRTGSERGSHISDDFMLFMAKYGRYCYASDRTTGCVLYELAMQRIGCGALVLKYKEVDTASEEIMKDYLEYITWYDEPKPMSEACWAFLASQMDSLLRSRENHNHAEAILFGLLESCDLNDTSLAFGYEKSPTSGKVYQWAMNVVQRHFSHEQVIVRLASQSMWRKYMDYWVKNWLFFSEKEYRLFFSKIKQVGFFARRRITKEIQNHIR